MECQYSCAVPASLEGVLADIAGQEIIRDLTSPAHDTLTFNDVIQVVAIQWLTMFNEATAAKGR